MRKRDVLLGGLMALAMCWGSAGHALELVDAVPRIKSSIVIVGTYRATDSPRFQLRGTGFVVGDGLQVVTNAHVLPEISGTSDAPVLSVQVFGQDGQLHQRGVLAVRRDPTHDLAVLSIDGDPVPALVLGRSARVREGQDLAFTGFPIGGVLGYSPVTHRATVSSITAAALPSPSARQLQDRAVRGLRSGTFDIFQLDATAYPGNSGGPLFDPNTGEVLGVLNMVLIKGTRESALSQPSGIAYAIPVEHVHRLLAQDR